MSFLESVLTQGGIFAIVCVGLYLTLASGQFSVAHAALMGLGSYAAGVVAVEFGWGFWPAIFAGLLVGGVVGFLISLAVSRLGDVLLGIATLAIGQAISLFVANIKYLGGSVGYVGVPLRTDLTSVALVLGISLALYWYFKNTRFGLAWLAVGKDETTAKAFGVSVLNVRFLGFAIGGMLAGAGGALMVQFVGLVQPQSLSFQAEIPLYVYVIIGGVTTPWGGVFGAVGLTWAMQALQFSPLDSYWLLGLLLIIALIFRKEGIFIRLPLMTNVVAVLRGKFGDGRHSNSIDGLEDDSAGKLPRKTSTTSEQEPDVISRDGVQ